MNLPFFIARRYLFARKSHNVINIISAISALGVATGTAALILILSIFNGFQDLVKSNLSSLDPDILIVPAGGKTFIPGGDAFDWLYEDQRVKTISSTIEENVFVEYDSHQGIARAKGVDKVYEEESDLGNYITQGKFALHNGYMPTCIVGAGLGRKLEVNPGFVSRLNLYFPDRKKNISLSNPGASVHSLAIRPSGLFSVRADVDDELMILPIECMRELMGYKDEVTSLEVRLGQGYSKKDVRRLIKETSDRLGPEYRILDRLQQHGSIYRMMQYEKAAIFLILIFVIIIISFNVFGSLSMLIIEKKEDIGTFRSFGTTEGTVKKIFTLEGWMISLLGMVAGLVTGVILALLQQKTGFIKMPGDFMVTAYPVVLRWTDVLLTAVCITFIGWVIALLPVRGRNVS